MKAIVVEQTGGPEQLTLSERPDPRPGPGELVVDVGAAGVNFIDIYQRQGIYPRVLPYVPGSEGAGLVSRHRHGALTSPDAPASTSSDLLAAMAA